MKAHQSTSLVADLRSHKTMLTTTEAIALLRTTRHTLCAWVRAGKIPAVRTPANSYIFDPVALAGWMQERSS